MTAASEPTPPAACVIPVLDVTGGVAVHARGGERARYQPIRSRLTVSADPFAVARALAEEVGHSTLYLADLDALSGKLPQYGLIAALAAAGAKLWVDAAISSLMQAHGILACGATQIIVGSESLATREPLQDLVQAFGQQLIFSLDLSRGRVLSGIAAWRETNPLAVAEEVAGTGLRSMILLDLAAVGGASGPVTLPLIRTIGAGLPQLTLIAGGGVRHHADLQDYAMAGAAGVLVATALHQRSLR